MDRKEEGPCGGQWVEGDAFAVGNANLIKYTQNNVHFFPLHVSTKYNACSILKEFDLTPALLIPVRSQGVFSLADQRIILISLMLVSEA